MRLEQFGYRSAPAWLRVRTVRPAYWVRGWLYIEGVLLAADGTPGRSVAVLVPADELVVYRRGGAWSG